MKISERFKQWLYESRWTLGFIEATPKDILDGEPYVVHYLRGIPQNRWFADPFILDVDEQNIHLLVEDYSYSTKKGIISRLTIDRHSYCLKERKPVLELPTHLSFPAILRQPEGNVFIYPENCESGICYIYEYDDKTNSCRKLQSLLDEPLTDAITNDLFGEKLIFTTLYTDHCGNGNILSVYSWDGQLRKQIPFVSNIARNGGDWFRIGEHIYRPAQDCNIGYGGAVILQEVMRENGRFVFKDIRRIESTHPIYNTGCHTFNSDKGITVIDLKGYRHYLLVNVIEKKNRIKWRIQRKIRILLGR